MADANCVGVVLCNTDRAMSPPSGGRKVLGTNPLAIAVPVEPAARPQLDMATSAVSLGKLLVAEHDGDEIPNGWAVDGRGRPTTSATAGRDGALLPAAGPKGFGLAFMIDALVAVAGAQISPHVAPLYGERSTPQRLGMLFLAIPASVSPGPAEYRLRIGDLIQEVRNSGVDEPPLFPGEPEIQAEHSSRGRISIPAGVGEELAAIAVRYSVPLPDAL